MDGTFHRRNLPPPAVSFGSAEGKLLFRDSLEKGYLEGYFLLAEHFITQGSRSFSFLSKLRFVRASCILWRGFVNNGPECFVDGPPPCLARRLEMV